MPINNVNFVFIDNFSFQKAIFITVEEAFIIHSDKGNKRFRR